VPTFLFPIGLPNAAKETSVDSTVVPLPDIREARRKKQMEELSRMHEAEEKEERVRIKRSDNAALRDVRFVCL
jgi:alpha-galactosidase/6-phospho-beta-glucosidase family protein